MARSRGGSPMRLFVMLALAVFVAYQAQQNDGWNV